MDSKESDGTIAIDGKTVTLEELRQRFPPSEKDGEKRYVGKCNYCNIEIIFSDPMQAKIIINDAKEGIERYSIYHTRCYERYLRRTID